MKEATQDKVDVYVVKQNSEGPVKIAHVENMEPLVVTSSEISKNLYDKIVDMFKRNRIESGSSSKT
ncbi:hypothetical protein K0M31_003016 [Melipona bicolor]|uniref:Uncharacterized protein n=1 Tax=Melipona bicolor TaxID=60889 RepID=A0AA40G013_9HYME|nr:hypothetical protein K0M31_003016 [Melipona bicolor]